MVGHWPPLVANVGIHSLGLSSGGGEVHFEDPLCHECRLVSWHLIWQGRCDHFLAGELASLLHSLTLGIGLMSAS
jgi:hypothetical protein